MVNINGIIGEKPSDAQEGELYVNLLNVIEQVQLEGEGDIYVNIDSIGGDVDVGFDICNYLIRLPNKIITECTGNCASAASIIFLAGDERIAGCPLMIHNPYVENVSGDKKLLEEVAQWIGEKEKQAEKFYTERTNLDLETISSLMESDTYITPNQAVTLGFATQAKTIAFAKLNKSTINNKEEEMSKKMKVLEALGLKPRAKAMALTTAEGSTLTVTREEGEPQVGDEATPDAVHTMLDGTVITVADGKITDISQASNEENTNITDADIEGIKEVVEEIVQENEELKKEVEELKEEIATAKAQIKTEEEVTILNTVMKAGGKAWLKNICSTYTPQARTGNTGKNEVQSRSSNVSAKLEKIKANRGL